MYYGKSHIRTIFLNWDIYQNLLKWKSSSRRKPLLLQGARQTGKTYILEEFGRLEYDNLFSFNFEKDPDLDQFFHRDMNPERIIGELSIYVNQKIKPGTDLIFFDEIQVSNQALNSLKYFAEQDDPFHVAAGLLPKNTTSLLLAISVRWLPQSRVPYV